MPRFPEVITLAEKTVQAAARGEASLPQRRRSASPGHKVVINDFTITLHEALWEQIKDDVDDMRRLQIFSATEVIVWNYPYSQDRPWPTVKE